MLANKLSGVPSGVQYVDDVFSTFTYTGNGSTQTINNGIDLAGKGGLVWQKSRSDAVSNILHWITSAGSASSGFLSTDTTAAAANPGYGANQFTSTGFSTYDDSGFWNNNKAGSTYVSWTFRKAPKFFDVVTYTGNGASNRSISHNLGSVPGMIIVKRTDAASMWSVFHRSLGGDSIYLQLQGTNAADSDANRFSSINSTSFNVGTSDGVNNSGGSFVAYLFAHDAAADGLIQCGSYTGNGSAAGPTITLGWEPQYLMVKPASAAGDWHVVDNMRGLTNSTATEAYLSPNLTSAEDLGAGHQITPKATGFEITAASSRVNASGATYIYLAIRRPNKPPTTGTQVYSGVAYDGNGVANRVVGSLLTDMFFIKRRTRSDLGFTWQSRLQGPQVALATAAYGSFPDGTSQERSLSGLTQNGFAQMSGLQLLAGGGYNETGPDSYSLQTFKRAPSVFDVVCYTGNDITNRQISHGLGVAPELVIVKARSNSGQRWAVLYANGTPGFAYLDADFAGTAPPNASFFGNGSSFIAPTASVFTVGSASQTNAALGGGGYVAYLFATKAGISKVGSYTGNGGTQTINCGFTTGARFILIKRTDSTGDWFVWDTTRGIVAGNDPHLSLNTTAAEVTTNDSIDPDTTGFIVNQVAATNINVNAATYIYLAFA